MAKRQTAPARGMRDLLPAEVALRQRCEQVIRERYAAFGYEAIETPALEHIELLTGGQGGENEKLIFKVLKRGEKLDLAGAVDESSVVDFGLRYDLTVPLARYYANNQGQLPAPFKALQIGPVWRAERPQKGRYRQFTQCDIDLLGEASLAAELDLLAATTATLSDLGLSGFSVRINDRRLLSRLVAAAGFDASTEGAVLISLDKLDKLGREGVAAELSAAGHAESAVQTLLGILDDGEAGLRRAVAGCETSAAALADLLRLGEAFAGSSAGGAVSLDPTLVRGMGYYTGTIFEVGLPGYGFSVAGGGRYDELVGALAGRSVPACGFSIGFERVVLVLGEQGAPTRTGERVALLFDPQKDGSAAVLEAAARLRGEGRCVSALALKKSMGRQLDDLAQHGFTAFCRFDATGAGELRPLGAGKDV